MHGDLTGCHQHQRAGVGEQAPGDLGDVAAAKHVAHTSRQFVDQVFFPRAPCGRAGGQRVRFGECVQQLESFD